jgi:hypothetical protein
VAHVGPQRHRNINTKFREGLVNLLCGKVDQIRFKGCKSISSRGAAFLSVGITLYNIQFYVNN